MGAYKVPLDFFNCTVHTPYNDEEFTERTRKIIKGVFIEHQIEAEMSSVAFGPSVVTFNVVLDRRVSPKRVLVLNNEFELHLGINGIRCYLNYEDGVVCIEVPNKKRNTVELGSLLQTEEMQTAKANELRIALGKDTRNRTITCDLSKMIHTLVAGSSGSGKSVFLNSIIASLIYKHSPKDLQLILIDPKMIEFTLYNGLPHLITGEPVTDLREGIEALGWAIAEMNRRYYLLEKMSREGTYVVNIDQYNQRVVDVNERLPKIVIIIDELADLMLVNKREVESRIQTLTQKSRAAGIYLIVSTQRPSPDVLTGTVKANFPTRVAFSVASEIDSRVILDCTGAQNLLGRGDYLYSRPGFGCVERMQASYISAVNILSLVDYIKENYPIEKDENVVQFIKMGGPKKEEKVNGVDPIYINALKMVIQAGSTSISMIQRKCAVGYNKAGQIVQWMEENGYISEFDGAKSRKVFITMEEFEAKFGEKRVEPEYIEALKFVVESGCVSIAILQRRLGMALNKASKIVDWMEKSGYISKFDEKNARKVLMTMEEFKRKFGV